MQKTRRAHAQLFVEYKCALRESGKGENACDGLPKSENAVKGKGGDFFWIERNVSEVADPKKILPDLDGMERHTLPDRE